MYDQPPPCSDELVVSVERVADGVMLQFPTRVRRLWLPMEAVNALAVALLSQASGLDVGMTLMRCPVPDSSSQRSDDDG